MKDFEKIITHVRRFKSATKEFSVDQLKEVKVKLEKIIDDRIAADEEAKKLNAEKIEKIEKYREMLAADGIAPDELAAEAPVKKGKKRAPRPPKYTITTDKGEVVTWTGQGRMPNVFKAQVDAGKSIDKFLIKK